MPKLWQYWWIDTLPTKCSEYIDITLDFPESIIVDRTFESEELNNNIKSMKSPHISSSCNKYICY